MQEADYKRHFDVISSEITEATRAFYTYIEIHKFGRKGNKYYNILNRDSGFWSGQLYALQTTWFIILGRIFDRTKGSFSIHGFLDSTAAYPGLFSKWALADRKCRDAQEDASKWVDDYVKSAWEPTREDLEKIRSIIADSDEKWKKIYKPIRDKVFAHNDPKVSAESLFQGTLISDIKDILHNLNRVRMHIFAMMENGQNYWIPDDDRTYADPFIQDVGEFLNRL
jgi:hypothetical protein